MRRWLRRCTYQLVDWLTPPLIEFCTYMGVNPKIGGSYPPKCMVKIMVPNPIKMDDLEGFYPYFWVDTHMLFIVTWQSTIEPLVGPIWGGSNRAQSFWSEWSCRSRWWLARDSPWICTVTFSNLHFFVTFSNFFPKLSQLFPTVQLAIPIFLTEYYCFINIHRRWFGQDLTPCFGSQRRASWINNDASNRCPPTLQLCVVKKKIRQLVISWPFWHDSYRVVRGGGSKGRGFPNLP